jgi:hypothetical protein
MKKVKLLMPILAIILIVSNVCIFSGCKKYPDNTFISLRSRAERVANTWTGASLSGSPLGLKLTKDGSGTLGIGGSNASGTWQFTNNDADINMSFNTTYIDYVTGDTTEMCTINCNILELMQNKMHLKGTFTITSIPSDPSNNGTANIEWTLTGSK